MPSRDLELYYEERIEEFIDEIRKLKEEAIFEDFTRPPNEEILFQVNSKIREINLFLLKIPIPQEYFLTKLAANQSDYDTYYDYFNSIINENLEKMQALKHALEKKLFTIATNHIKATTNSAIKMARELIENNYLLATAIVQRVALELLLVDATRNFLPNHRIPEKNRAQTCLNKLHSTKQVDDRLKKSIEFALSVGNDAAHGRKEPSEDEIRAIFEIIEKAQEQLLLVK